jgi:ATP-dependent Lon protease
VDIHLHIPEGAIPKDGPSAGVTITTALVSAFTGREVYREVGMTGEITLRGRVLPVGGVREKVLAAHRAGLKTVILPKRNLKDLIDVPKRARSEVRIIPVEHVEQVLEIALAPARVAKPRRPRKPVPEQGESKTESMAQKPIPVRRKGDTPGAAVTPSA